MNTKKIKEAEISHLRIASLPSRPTAPTSFGGKGFTATEMKEAFDKLPLYIIERLNSLIEDITSLGDGSAAASIPTGIKEGHSLGDLFSDIVSGAVADYLTIFGEPLSECIMSLKEIAESHPEDINALRVAWEEMTGELAGLDTRLGEMRSALGEAAEEMGTLEDNIAAAVADILLIDTSLNELIEGQQSFANEGKERDEKISTLEGRLDLTDESFNSISERTSSTEAGLSALGARVSETESTLESLAERADTTESTLESLAERADTTESGLSAIEAQISELEARVDGAGTGGSIFRPDEVTNEHTVHLEHAMDARLGQSGMIYLSLPDEPQEDYYATLSFYSGDQYTCLEITSEQRIYFTGSRCYDDGFWPEMYEHYTLFFWYDGLLHCNVRAVYYDG